MTIGDAKVGAQLAEAPEQIPTTRGSRARTCSTCRRERRRAIRTMDTRLIRSFGVETRSNLYPLGPEPSALSPAP